MASIEKRVSSTGKVSYRAKVRRSGDLPLSKTFARKSDAEAWAREIEARADRGFAIPSREQITRPLSDAIDRWLTDRLPELSRTDQANARRIALRCRAEVGREGLCRVVEESSEV